MLRSVPLSISSETSARQLAGVKDSLDFVASLAINEKAAQHCIARRSRCVSIQGVATGAVVFDIGGVLEITPPTGWEQRWARELGLPG